MILVFGGTTEGRRTVKELEEAGNVYYYSTKNGEQDIAMNNGIRLNGAMLAEQMRTFCIEKEIKLIVDAAHPFAEHLHNTVAGISKELDIPAIRFERIFPERDTENIIWCSDYADAMSKMSGVKTLLATTGVQSIARLKPLEERGMHVIYRILPRESSVALAHEQGADDANLCYYDQGEDEIEVLQRLNPDAILLKEAGETGGFEKKIDAAKTLGIRIFAISKPKTPSQFHIVNGPHGLRRMVENLLPDFYPLHSGLTTGTCATAAALASAYRLLLNECPDIVPVYLPNGETIHVSVAYGESFATVIKDAGDDPDVTDGIEIRASVTLRDDDAVQTEQIEILGGDGVGIITLKGFDYPPGSPAINKVPRQMIRENITRRLKPDKPLVVTISIPKGKELARKTFNPRIGIVNGISVVGVSGIIKPFSKEGFLDSIRKCMDVAKATDCDRVVINSGAKSERYIKSYYPELPSQVFVQYGNFIGETIKMASEVGFRKLTLGVMIGKAVKLAAGNLDTHSHKVTMNKDFIVEIVKSSGCDEETVQKAKGINLARELWDIIPAENIQSFADMVIENCKKYCEPLFGVGELTIILVNENGIIYTAS